MQKILILKIKKQIKQNHIEEEGIKEKKMNTKMILLKTEVRGPKMIVKKLI